MQRHYSCDLAGKTQYQRRRSVIRILENWLLAVWNGRGTNVMEMGANVQGLLDFWVSAARQIIDPCQVLQLEFQDYIQHVSIAARLGSRKIFSRSN